MPIDRLRWFQRRMSVLIILAAAAQLGAQDRMEWRPVDGAAYYEVEIRKDGELVLETRASDAWLPLFLPAGEYRFKVRVINTFGRTASESEWAPLLVRAPVIPFAIALEPGRIHEGYNGGFNARVSGFVPGTDGAGSLFRLEHDEEKPIELEILGSSGEDSWTGIQLDTGRRDPGTGIWSLVMVNPDGRENRIEAALEVLPSLRPRIRSVNPDEFAAGQAHNPMSIRITGMEEGARVSFLGPSDLKAAVIPGIETDIIEYSLDLTEAEAGEYSVSVVNPSGGSDTREKAFEVRPRPLTEEELEAMNALKIDEKEPLPLDSRPRSLFFGWSAMIPIGATTDFYKPGYFGLTLGFSQNFHNDFFRKIYWLDGLSWDFSFNYSSQSTGYPILDINLHRYSFLLGLNYVSPFNFPVNILLRAGSGLGFSVYTSPDVGPDEDAGGFTLSELGSMDYVMRFGGGMQISIGNRWYVNVLCDVTATFYLSRAAWSVRPALEGGWRF